MKKPIATIAFFAALGTLTVSCQKESMLLSTTHSNRPYREGNEP